MKKFLSILVIASILGLFQLNYIYAQETNLPPATEGDTQLPIGEEQDPNPPDEEENKEEVIDEDRNQTFLNGVLAGGVIGLILGAILAWLFKDKFYK